MFRFKPTASSCSTAPTCTKEVTSASAPELPGERPFHSIAPASAPSAALFREGRRRRDGATGTMATGLLLMHNGAHITGSTFPFRCSSAAWTAHNRRAVGNARKARQPVSCAHVCVLAASPGGEVGHRDAHRCARPGPTGKPSRRRSCAPEARRSARIRSSRTCRVTVQSAA